MEGGRGLVASRVSPAPPLPPSHPSLKALHSNPLEMGIKVPHQMGINKRNARIQQCPELIRPFSSWLEIVNSVEQLAPAKSGRAL